MADVTGVIVETDGRPSKAIQWHLLKSPSGVQTAVTAAKLSQHWRNVTFAATAAGDDFEFADVSWCKLIRVQVWGVGSDNHAPVIDVYGWNDNGPGQHVAKVTCTMGAFVSEDRNNAAPGWHTDTKLHPRMKASFLPDVDYRGCDTYAVTNDYEQDAIVDSAVTPIQYQQHKSVWVPAATSAGGTPLEADFPSFFVVDLSRSYYKYLCAAVTDLGSATSAGAIFRAACLR